VSPIQKPRELPDLFGKLALPRQTSIEAYERLVKEGRLGQLQLKVAWLLASRGAMTAQELCREGGHSGLWKRLSELRELGHVVEVGTRKCSVTGREAILWGIK
jgi:hypothetical protein